MTYLRSDDKSLFAAGVLCREVVESLLPLYCVMKGVMKPEIGNGFRSYIWHSVLILPTIFSSSSPLPPPSFYNFLFLFPQLPMISSSSFPFTPFQAPLFFPNYFSPFLSLFPIPLPLPPSSFPILLFEMINIPQRHTHPRTFSSLARIPVITAPDFAQIQRRRPSTPPPPPV